MFVCVPGYQGSGLREGESVKRWNGLGAEWLLRRSHSASSIPCFFGEELMEDPGGSYDREYIADEMNHLRISVDGALEDLPRRKIRLAA